MAENQTQTGTAAAEPAFTPVNLGTATRNGQSVTIQTKEFKRQSKDKAGANFVGIPELTLVELTQFIGAEECRAKLQAWADQKCQGIWREAAINNTGKPDDQVDDNELEWDNDKCLPDFVNRLQEWSAISETITDLKAERDSLVKELTIVVTTKALSATTPAERDAVFAEGQAIAKKISKVELDIAAKKRKTKAEREAEKAAKPAPVVG